MPPDQPVNPAGERPPASSPSRPEGPADGTMFSPGALRAPASRVRVQSQVMRIGRSPGNDIIVSDLGVSKQHAELRRSPTGRYSIIDLGSHNGTYVNGTRVSQQELKEGVIVAIGPATFRLVGGELIEYVDDILVYVESEQADPDPTTWPGFDPGKPMLTYKRHHIGGRWELRWV